MTANSNLSKGHAHLLESLSRLIPNEKIVTEHHIGERLRLDIFCPKLNIGVEYHGRQHFEYVEHFHGDIKGFKESQRRDERKVELCKELGIGLAVFTYVDDLNDDMIFSRVTEAINSRPEAKAERPKRELSDFEKKMRDRRREWNKKRYREMKRKRDNERRK